MTIFEIMRRAYMEDRRHRTPAEIAELANTNEAAVRDELARLDQSLLFRFRGRTAPSHSALCEPHLERALRDDC